MSQNACGFGAAGKPAADADHRDRLGPSLACRIDLSLLIEREQHQLLLRKSAEPFDHLAHVRRVPPACREQPVDFFVGQLCDGGDQVKFADWSGIARDLLVVFCKL